jgi:hypothetical protein
MDSARQALRWSIPGLIFVLELFAFAAVWQLAAGKNPLSVLDDISSTTALATLLAGIPIGFLLYQLYYRNYRPYGRSVLLFLRFPHQVKHGLVRARRFWSFVRRDRGAEILRQYYDLGGHPTFVRRSWGKSDAPATGDDEQIREVTEPRILLRSGRPSSFKVLTLRADANLHEPCTASAPADCGDCRKAYAHRFRWNWAIVMAMIDFAGSRTDGATIKNEYAAGSDIYHRLGRLPHRVPRGPGPVVELGRRGPPPARRGAHRAARVRAVPGDPQRSGAVVAQPHHPHRGGAVLVLAAARDL